MKTTTITKKGQVTIPKSVREELNIEAGDEVIVEMRNGEAVLAPKVKDPLGKMRELREKIQFTPEELEQMRRESKREWSQLPE